MITILDYSMGNLRSVAKAFETLNAQVEVTHDLKKILNAKKLVFPGQGAFHDCVEYLNANGLWEVLHQYLEAKKPYLGICLGMQILMESSEEAPGKPGLGYLKGEVVRFSQDWGLKIPHMGWNQLKVKKPSRLLAGLDKDPEVYFVHSYYIKPQGTDLIAAQTEYGEAFVSVLESEHIFATQFHPEKSQRAGLKILKNFLEI